MPIYIAQMASDGPCKIGFSQCVADRITQLQLEHTHVLHLRRVLDGGRDDERRLHEKFAEQRIEREWFLPVDAMFNDLGMLDITHQPRAYFAPCNHEVGFRAEWSEAFFSWLERITDTPDAMAHKLGVKLSTLANWIRYGSVPDVAVRAKLIELSDGRLAPYLGRVTYQVVTRDQTRAA